jgi:D-3-phosphoglycerate dehydrogenase / 2-oxoglutarate reductase
MRIIVHDPYIPAADIESRGAAAVSFGQLLEDSDYLLIQAPLTKQTRHLIGEAELRRMKPTAILVNTGRGPIVDDDALYQGLSEGWIAGAGLDDIEEEPAKQRDWMPANPLFSLSNVVITPHAAYYSEESIEAVRDFAAREVVRVLTGKPPLSPVNADQLAARAKTAGPPGRRPARSLRCRKFRARGRVAAVQLCNENVITVIEDHESLI